MKPTKILTSACRYCRHYQPEGRRGGICQQLGASVQASWKACSLALPPFAPAWETLEDAWSLPDARPVLVSAQSLASDLHHVALLAPVEEKTVCTAEQTKATTALI
ncbi:hypothetical protein [Fortiea contorta]|uniref:hypothetical protein n=1 Tax=Fortiea contorta TaxID=1892405 RepID=UPI000345AA26|nr:hypothetical protein [Fortiea contorta]